MDTRVSWRTHKRNGNSGEGPGTQIQAQDEEEKRQLPGVNQTFRVCPVRACSSPFFRLEKLFEESASGKFAA